MLNLIKSFITELRRPMTDEEVEQFNEAMMIAYRYM